MIFVRFVCFFIHVLVCCDAYKPVVLMHGILPSPDELPDFQDLIFKIHPGTNVTLITAYNEKIASLTPMWKQTRAAGEIIRRASAEHPNGFHLLCYSQGGLVCRAALQTIPDHNVDTFISLTSPQAGQYGDPDFLKHYIPPMVREELYAFFYTKTGQLISIGNYWNDPHHQKLYEKESVFLAVINNPKFREEYRKNFLRVKKLVLIGSPDDGVIIPWQSSQFGFYDSKDHVLPMQQQSWFSNDTFGLQTLAKQKRLHVFTVPGVQHTQWHKNRTVFEKFVAPWLT
ncbi:lysosomal thioesterase PPT2-A-like isoform X2 [Tubulanus polymorphus]|uniref:lysosomal thioesterase PPT2-A-like isoform X2 n=1 Tax=Tubulanus polymorphus TaxID=672921 RepID=UPI003DA578ED